MSGGIAYVWNPKGELAARVNRELVDLDPVLDADDAELRGMVERHARYTDSPVAKALLADWAAARAQFVKVMPIDYKRVLQGLGAREEAA
jgi:glutamate synthase domain-containing protein 3